VEHGPANAAVLMGVVHRWLAFLTAELDLVSLRSAPLRCPNRCPTPPQFPRSVCRASPPSQWLLEPWSDR
jgi:hypothetical protein